jgi:DNA excision repair protein ERCC-4
LHNYMPVPPIPTQIGPPVAIVADDRERASGVIDHLRAIPGVAVGIERLPAGDYLADRKLLFERKTLQDLSISIVDGRLFRQMGALAKTRNKAALILEGTAKDSESVGVRREAVQGALISISLLLGIPVLRSVSAEETARLIVYAARQLQAVGKSSFPRFGYRPGTKKGRQLFILQGLPGVGRERALRLLEKFGSVEAVIRAEREELLAVEGVGAKTADRIRWAVSENQALYGYDPDTELERLGSDWPSNFDPPRIRSYMRSRS